MSSTADGCSCHGCGRTYVSADGIMRLATRECLERMAPFLKQYRAIRLRDGHGPRSAEQYRALPDVPPDTPHRAEWRIRRESLATLLTIWKPDQATAGESPARILDLGAGNGWVSYRLSTRGHTPVAVDLNTDDADGLGACRAFDAAFLTVQADFDALPFAPRQFDLVVLNASLHYSQDPWRTLCEANRMLTDRGALAVIDSPMFTRAGDGEAMVEQQGHALREQLGVMPVRVGTGFLTFARLEEWAARLGRSAQFITSRGSLRWQFGRCRARRRLGRAPATFGVWMAQ